MLYNFNNFLIFESKSESNKLKDLLFDNVMSGQLNYTIQRSGKKVKRTFVPDIPEDLKKYVNRLLNILELSKSNVNKLPNLKHYNMTDYLNLTKEEQNVYDVERRRQSNIQMKYTAIKNILFWILMEIKFEDSFKESKKDFIKYVTSSMDKIVDDQEMLDHIHNTWSHHNHPIATSIYFADTIPEVRSFLTEFGQNPPSSWRG